MGFIFSKLLCKATPSQLELQKQILNYIYNGNVREKDFKSVAKHYRTYGFISIDHFISGIPTQVWQDFENKFGRSLEHWAKSNDIASLPLGTRFVHLKDYATRGSLVGQNWEMGVFLELDQPQNGRVVPSIMRLFKPEEILFEKIYLRNLLLKGILPQPKYSETIQNNNLEKKSFKTLHTMTTTQTSKPIRLYADVVTNTERQVDEGSVLANVKIDSSKPKEVIEILPLHQSLQDKSRNSIIFGRKRGIQGRNNSCYLDATLFTLFYTDHLFDDAFLSETERDSQESRELKRVLANQIVAPLRTPSINYCPYENIQNLRHSLSYFNPRILGEMMDAEELLYLILEEILDCPHFLKYVGGNGDFIHQIMLPDQRDDGSKQFIKMQNCLENSFEAWGHLQMKSVPKPAFVIQVPRSDGVLVDYEGIFPNLKLNMKPLIWPENCQGCKTEVSTWESFSEDIKYCNNCILENKAKKFVSLNCMQLFGVICINSSHYTSFVKMDKKTKDWLYFDSMAGQYPEVTLLKDFENNLSNHEIDTLNAYVQKIQRDCHICIYAPITYKDNSEQ